ncbi:MAG: acyl-CoA thioesterase domain-containing protein [Gammaproteobacteria bacterium]
MDLHLTPEPQADPHRYRYAARRPWCSWNGLFGGALAGALIAAMEHAAGRPLAAFSVQYLRNVREGVELAIETENLAVGSTSTQMAATATLPEGRAAIASATFGGPGATPRIDAEFPEVGPADEAPPRAWMRPLTGGLNETLDIRVAAVHASRVLLWARCPAAQGMPSSAALLACIADQPPFGIMRLLGGQWYGISLEASLKIVTAPQGRDGGAWTLVEIVFDAIASPFAFATVNLWSTDGTLLAIGSQSMRIRNGIQD